MNTLLAFVEKLRCEPPESNKDARMCAIDLMVVHITQYDKYYPGVPPYSLAAEIISSLFLDQQEQLLAVSASGTRSTPKLLEKGRQKRSDAPTRPLLLFLFESSSGCG